MEQAGRVAAAGKHNTRCKPSVLLYVKRKAVLQAPHNDSQTYTCYTQSYNLSLLLPVWGGGGGGGNQNLTTAEMKLN